PELDWNCLAIIDDDEQLNEIIKKFLEKEGFSFNIVQAYDGFAAGALLTERKPGFIILDIDLPGLDGNAICRKIKSDPAFGKPFVITVTGLDAQSIKTMALDAGADAFLSKPLDFDALRTIMIDFSGKVR
ncbi:MAG TPA: response regulator, partial [Spirochaetales bacterium]|nr:response regulator [Spirochaetales bacterium]